MLSEMSSRMIGGIRVTLVVDLQFSPQNFGPMVGTYEGLCCSVNADGGGDRTCRWWGHITTICCHQSFLTQR